MTDKSIEPKYQNFRQQLFDRTTIKTSRESRLTESQQAVVDQLNQHKKYQLMQDYVASCPPSLDEKWPQDQYFCGTRSVD